MAAPFWPKQSDRNTCVPAARCPVSGNPLFRRFLFQRRRIEYQLTAVANRSTFLNAPDQSAQTPSGPKVRKMRGPFPAFD